MIYFIFIVSCKALVRIEMLHHRIKAISQNNFVLICINVSNSRPMSQFTPLSIFLLLNIFALGLNSHQTHKTLADI